MSLPQQDPQPPSAVVNKINRDDVETYLRGLSYSPSVSDEARTLVAGNIRGFLQWLATKGHVVIEGESS